MYKRRFVDNYGRGGHCTSRRTPSGELIIHIIDWGNVEFVDNVDNPVEKYYGNE